MEKWDWTTVEREYVKNKNIKQEDVKRLMEWVHQQPHLPKLTELEVLFFFHSNKCSQGLSKISLDNYYTCRTHSDIFNGRIARTLEPHMGLAIYQFLPELTPAGYGVLYIRLIDKDPTHFNFLDQLKIATMVMELNLMKNGICEGFLILFNTSDGQLGHLARLGITHFKQFLYFLQEAAVVIVRGIHLINIIPLVDKLMALAKPFLKKELLDVIYFHKDGLESVYPCIPKRMLPKELGGDGPTEEQMLANQKRELLAYADYFVEEEMTRRVNEALRPGKPKTVSDIFGIEGSFKKLDID